jgi:GWxTD domain-containing protein
MILYSLRRVACVPGLCAALVVVGCRSSGPREPATAQPRSQGRGGTETSGRTASQTGLQFDATRLYQQLGLLARGAPFPFVGSVGFLATPRPDSTHLIVAISLSNASLTFGRENDRFRAGYTVGIVLRAGAITARQSESHESVLVSSFRETSRVDESVIYQEILTVPPGRYNLAVTVRDDGSSRASSEDVTLSVPVLGAGSLSTPITFARVTTRATLDSVPRLVTSPRATVVFGRDSVIPFYLEALASPAEGRVLLQYAARNESGRAIFSDTASLPWRGGVSSGVVNVPTARIGIGPVMISFWRPGRGDTTRAPAFVGFGEDLPVATYDEMLNYLRYFTSPYRLKALRDTAPEFRAAAWANFAKETGSLGGSNEALHGYFARLVKANLQFKEEAMPGWLTDRGRVLLGLGEPDQSYEQGLPNVNARGRTQIWEYRALNLQLTFYDQTGFGRWRLTSSSEIEFEAAWRRRVT